MTPLEIVFKASLSRAGEISRKLTSVVVFLGALEIRERYAEGEMWVRNDIDGTVRYGNGSECERSKNMSKGAFCNDNDLKESNLCEGDQFGGLRVNLRCTGLSLVLRKLVQRRTYIVDVSEPSHASVVFSDRQSI